MFDLEVDWERHVLVALGASLLLDGAQDDAQAVLPDVPVELALGYVLYELVIGRPRPGVGDLVKEERGRALANLIGRQVVEVFDECDDEAVDVLHRCPQ